VASSLSASLARVTQLKALDPLALDRKAREELNAATQPDCGCGG